MRLPVLRAQMCSPGYRERPWMVRKLRSVWKPARMVSFWPYFWRSEAVGARRWGLSRSAVNALENYGGKNHTHIGLHP
jgi:hypothetical protein